MCVHLEVWGSGWFQISLRKKFSDSNGIEKKINGWNRNQFEVVKCVELKNDQIRLSKRKYNKNSLLLYVCQLCSGFWIHSLSGVSGKSYQLWLKYVGIRTTKKIGMENHCFAKKIIMSELCEILSRIDIRMHISLGWKNRDGELLFC